jgi:NTE family protein
MRVVAVFSGGGAKALAHAGAFRALQQAGLEPNHIVATSMGAVIGAGLAAGVPFEEVRRRSLGLRRKDVAPFDPLALVKGMFARSLIPGSALRRTIERLVPAKRFAHLKIPLTVTATDLDSGELLLFPVPGSRDPVPELHDALYASCALPLYFPPLELDGRRFADGGLRAVLPLEPALAIPADLVVAVNVGPGFDEAPVPSFQHSNIPALVRAHGEAIRIMMAAQAERAVADWPKDAPRLVYVRPVAEREATFAVERLEQYVEAGYQATKKAIA